QVGVLRGLARHLPRTRPVILTGESAGAINVVHLAAYPGALPEAIEDLASLWIQLTADQLFRVGPLSLASNVLRWGTRLISGGAAGRRLVRRWGRPPPRAPLARNSPRRETDPRGLDPLPAYLRGGRPTGRFRLSSARPGGRDPPGRDLP